MASTSSLLVRSAKTGKFYFVESVKNGFVPATRQSVFDAIKGKEIAECPFVNLPEKKGAHRMDREKMETVRWMKPKIIAEIAFNERTENGYLRHSRFVRLREKFNLRKQKRKASWVVPPGDSLPALVDVRSVMRRSR